MNQNAFEETYSQLSSNHSYAIIHPTLSLGYQTAVAVVVCSFASQQVNLAHNTPEALAVLQS